MTYEKYERYQQRRKEKAGTIARKTERQFKYQQPQLFSYHEDGCDCLVCQYEEQNVVYSIYRRVWYKRRFGYYEKPSILRRKRKRASYMGMGLQIYRLYIDLTAQFRRTGPGHAAGR